MLKHENNPPPQAPSQPAANVRVTPEELAAAVTALQIRKEGSPGTIAIGDAVEELGLDVSPEEVLVEVEARRIKPKRRLDYRALACAIACAALPGIIFVVFAMLPQPTQSFVPPTNSAIGSVTSPSVAVPADTAPIPVVRDASSIQLDLLSLRVSDASGKLMFISEAKDHQAVHCLLEDQFSSFNSYSPGCPKSLLWTLIKHDGQWYVRGWIPRMSKELLQREGADVDNRRAAGYSVPVTLALSRFKVPPVGGGNVQFHAMDVHLDGHAYEKWSE